MLGFEQLTGALLDRSPTHVSMLTEPAANAEQNQATELVDLDSGEIITS